MSDQPIHVLLCDDHRIVREGLKQMLADDASIRVAGEAASADELLSAIPGLLQQGGRPVLVLDIVTAPRVEEMTPVTVNAVLPLMTRPFWEIISGWVPMFFSVTVCAAVRLPAPSLRTAPKAMARSFEGATESETLIPGRFAPDPESVT